MITHVVIHGRFGPGGLRGLGGLGVGNGLGTGWGWGRSGRFDLLARSKPSRSLLGEVRLPGGVNRMPKPTAIAAAAAAPAAAPILEAAPTFAPIPAAAPTAVGEG